MSSHRQRLLSDTLLVAAANHPDKVALVVEGQEFTYSELLRSARRFAAALQAREISRGDRVAIYMDNTWSCAVSIYGSLLAGAVFLVINPQTKADKLAYILEDSGAKFLSTDGHLAKTFAPLLPDQEQLVAVFCSGRLSKPFEGSPPIECFDAVLETAAEMPEGPGTISVDLAALIYTSGSTGDPKGVMMYHRAMLFTVESLVEYLRLSPEHRLLTVLPFAFDYGLYQLLMCMCACATL